MSARYDCITITFGDNPEHALRRDHPIAALMLAGIRRIENRGDLLLPAGMITTLRVDLDTMSVGVRLENGKGERWHTIGKHLIKPGDFG